MALFRIISRFLAFGAVCTTAVIVSSSFAIGQIQVLVPVPPSQRVEFAPNAPGERGRSVDISGNRLIVGANNTALIYEETTPGNWSFVQRLEQPVFTDDGGESVGISGDLAVVGAPYDGGYNNESGAVFYSYDQFSWNVDLNAQTGIPSHLFGVNVALSGDTAVVSAQRQSPRGHVYFFEYDGTQWLTTLNSTGFSSGPFVSQLCGDVAISGDVAAATYRFHPTEQIIVYRRTNGVWAEDQGVDLNIPELANAGFVHVAFNVAIDGNTLLSEVRQSATSVGYLRGVAVFVDQGSGFVYKQVLLPADGSSSQKRFGSALAIKGDQVIIGAYKDVPWGAAYSFRRDSQAELFTERAKYVPTGGEYTPVPGVTFSPDFGYSVAVSSSNIVIGARRDYGFGTAYVLPNIQLPNTIQAFCFGSGGVVAGCTDCPCGNNADEGIIGGCLNSGGSNAVLSIHGQASATNDTARLELARAKPAVLTLLASSESMLPLNPGATPCPRGSGIRSAFFDGLRCIGGPIVRHGTRMTDATGAVEGDTGGWGGQFAPAEGLVAQGSFAISQQRFFQAISRDDPMLSCGTGLNTSSAVAIQVVP